MTLRSKRNLTICDPEPKCKNFTSTPTTEIFSSSNNYNPLIFSLIDNTSFLKNNDVENKGMNNTRRDEQSSEASNQVTSSTPLLPQEESQGTTFSKVFGHLEIASYKHLVC